jgi:hypothetical protein
MGWTYFVYSLLLGKPTFSVSVWNSYAALHGHRSGALVDEVEQAMNV